MNLKGKTAMVTGASKGIGLSVVKALLQQEGMKVAAWSRTAPDFKHENLHFYSTDISKVNSVQESYKTTVKDLGVPSVLVNNAGLGYSALIEEMPVEQWEEMFAVNVNGLFYCSKAAIPDMKKAGEGHIINIASLAGTAGSETLAGYCGTKFAVRGISEAMFKELRDYGIKVTCINPGSVQTNFFKRMDGSHGSSNKLQADDVTEAILYVLKSSANALPSEIDLRPLMPKGKKL